MKIPLLQIKARNAILLQLYTWNNKERIFLIKKKGKKERRAFDHSVRRAIVTIFFLEIRVGFHSSSSLGFLSGICTSSAGFALLILR